MAEAASKIHVIFSGAASSRRALFIFSRAVFRVSPQLTERLEKASGTFPKRKVLYMRHLWIWYFAQ